MRNAWKMRLGSLLFGGSCFLCRGAARDFLCPDCDADLPRLDFPLCPRCALPSPGGATCGRCLAEKPAYDATRAALAYDFPADALVHSLKFRGELALAGLLGALLRGRIDGDRVDCVVPMPLAPARLRERGYNQAVEIARHLGRTGLDLALCERTRESRPQMELPYDERQRNVRGAFRCTRALVGARVAVVDDVMTTGATLNELARTLKAAGAVHVSNWVVTRAL
ncbi:MAG TPA: ComF family protein [Burkholderiales bacterium]|nr:ComF family protein [Burkholderiales bacterium]